MESEATLLDAMKQKEILLKRCESFKLDLHQKIKTLEGMMLEVDAKAMEITQGYETNVELVQVCTPFSSTKVST